MEENKRKTGKRIAKRQMNKKKLMILIAIIVIITVIVIAVQNSNKKKESKVEEKEQNVEKVVTQNNTLIDYTNTENVIIVGERKENNSAALLKTKEIDGMTVKEISLYALNGVTNFSATVENGNGVDFDGGPIEIIFLNKDGSEYGRLQANLPKIAAGGSNKISASTTADLTNAYSFKIEF